MARDRTFEDLIGFLKEVFDHCPDKRTGKNSRYTMRDIGMSAFSVFFTQSPSFLEHQRVMRGAQGKDNAQSLFSVSAIPSDNHIRDCLDPLLPPALFPVFEKCYQVMEEEKYLDEFRVLEGQLLIPLDGTCYFSSKDIHCEHCSTQTSKKGEVTYLHHVITPVIASPKQGRVISLPPEFICPQDGAEKQDCEIAAAKRWIKAQGVRYADKKVIFLGDDLYAHEPFCREAKQQRFGFLLTCKVESHKALYAHLSTRTLEEKTVRRHSTKTIDTFTYRWAKEVPLTSEKNALKVNWFELTITNASNKTTYHNSWITDQAITDDNITELAACARTRWKIENENNNTLKNQGYHLEHNFGHGKKHLASFLLTLNLLAFLFHTLLHFTDKKYNELRERASRRMTFFEHLRTLTCFLYFSSWENLLDFMLQGGQTGPPRRR